MDEIRKTLQEKIKFVDKCPIADIKAEAVREILAAGYDRQAWTEARKSMTDESIKEASEIQALVDGLRAKGPSAKSPRVIMTMADVRKNLFETVAWDGVERVGSGAFWAEHLGSDHSLVDHVPVISEFLQGAIKRLYEPGIEATALVLVGKRPNVEDIACAFDPSDALVSTPKGFNAGRASFVTVLSGAGKDLGFYKATTDTYKVPYKDETKTDEPRWFSFIVATERLHDAVRGHDPFVHFVPLNGKGDPAKLREVMPQVWAEAYQIAAKE